MHSRQSAPDLGPSGSSPCRHPRAHACAPDRLILDTCQRTQPWKTNGTKGMRCATRLALSEESGDHLTTFIASPLETSRGNKAALARVPCGCPVFPTCATARSPVRFRFALVQVRIQIQIQIQIQTWIRILVPGRRATGSRLMKDHRTASATMYFGNHRHCQPGGLELARAHQGPLDVAPPASKCHVRDACMLAALLRTAHTPRNWLRQAP